MAEPEKTPGRLSQLMPILAFNAAYLLAAVTGSVVSGNSEFVLYIVIMLVLGSVVWLADRRVGFSPFVLWGLSGWGLVHMAGGLIAVPETWPINGEHRVLYSLWLIPDLLKYDHVVHAFGFGVTTLVCWEGLCAILKAQRTSVEPAVPVLTLRMLTLCGAASMGFSEFNLQLRSTQRSCRLGRSGRCGRSFPNFISELRPVDGLL